MTVRPKDSPVAPRAGKTAAILTVSSADRPHDQLRAALQRNHFRVVEVASVREAIRAVSRHRIFAIVCESELSDGTFRELLCQTGSQVRYPLIIVTSRNADEQLWGEVINLGGYDVLAQPFDEIEVGRVADAAWRQWRRDAEPMPSASAKASAGRWSMPAVGV